MTCPVVADWRAGLRAITLDFGNTLVPVARGELQRAIEVTAHDVAIRCGPFEAAAFLDAWDEERDRQFAEEVPNFREVDLEQRVVRVLARLRGMAAPSRDVRWDDAAAAALSDPEEVAWAVERYSRGFVEAVPPPVGVERLLARLAARYRLAVLSNWPLAATIDRYVEAAGWASHLHAVVVSQRVGTIKPRPAIFAAAAEALGVEPAAILHVGDDWAADVVGAKGAGWRAAYLRARPDGSPLPTSERGEAGPPDLEPDLELERLADLPAALGLAG